MVEVTFSSKHKILQISKDETIIFLYRGTESRLAFVLLEFDKKEKDAIHKEEMILSSDQIETARSIADVAKAVVKI